MVISCALFTLHENAKPHVAPVLVQSASGKFQSLLLGWRGIKCCGFLAKETAACVTRGKVWVWVASFPSV